MSWKPLTETIIKHTHTLMLEAYTNVHIIIANEVSGDETKLMNTIAEDPIESPKHALPSQPLMPI